MVRVSISKKAYGGNFYEDCIDKALQSHFGIQYEVQRLEFKLPGLFKVFELPMKILELRKAQKKGTSFIVNFVTIPLLPFLKNSITLVHHIDSTGAALPSKIYQLLAEAVFKFIYSRTNRIVVVADYWKKYVENLGFTEVQTIYNPFEINKYLEINDSHVENFLLKYNLPKDKPIIYVGNPLPQKGYPQVVEKLKDLPYTLISTGEGFPDGKTLHLKLPFSEYICLLKAAKAVITFSQFKEGWCRVAHEAMIVGTPVIGSGSGGMEELLREGQQHILKDINQLPEQINELTAEDRNGKSYARSFTIERFCKAWQEIVQ